MLCFNADEREKIKRLLKKDGIDLRNLNDIK
jgi:hypothetical protein